MSTTRSFKHSLIPSTRMEAKPGTTRGVRSTLTTTLQKKEATREAYNAMDEEGRKVIQSEVMKTAKEAYLACLFILMTDDERYGASKRRCGTITCWASKNTPRTC